jgi:hypothetical protein
MAQHKKKESSPKTSFRSFVGGNWEVDLTNQETRKQFVDTFSKTTYWCRALDPSRSTEVNVDKRNKIAFLLEVRPEKLSRFYLDIDSLGERDPNEVVDSIKKWTNNIVINPDNQKTIFFLSKSTEKGTRLHCYWPELCVESISKRKQLAKSLEQWIKLEIDDSVYNSGLRLPGCLKPESTAFYYLFGDDGLKNFTVDDILLCPREGQTQADLNFEFIDVNENLNPKKRKFSEIKNADGKILQNNDQLPKKVLEEIAKRTPFQPPYKIMKKGRTENIWILNYNHKGDQVCIHGAKHDSWGFAVSWKRTSGDLKVECLQEQDCKKKGWLHLGTVNVQPEEETIDHEISFDNSLGDQPQPLDTSEPQDPLKTTNQTEVPLVERLENFDFEKLEKILRNNGTDQALLYLNHFLAQSNRPPAYWSRWSDDNRWEIIPKEGCADILIDYKSNDGQSIWDIWRRWKNRRRCIGVQFYPGDLEKPKILNQFNGFEVDPCPDDISDEELMTEVGEWEWHIKNVICGGDPAQYNYLLNHLASGRLLPSEDVCCVCVSCCLFSFNLKKVVE